MSDLYQKIVLLCEKSEISGGKMCKDLGISRGILTDLKMERKKTLSAETLAKIASYFDVSIDYLIGNTDEKRPVPQQDQDEPEITFDDFTYALHNETKGLNDHDKEMILEMAKMFKARMKEKEQ